MRRVYQIDLGSRSLHNTMKFEPLVDEVYVVKVSTIDDSGQSKAIVANKSRVHGPISIRYPNIISQYVDVEIEADSSVLTDSLRAMQVAVGTTTYKKEGSYTQQPLKIDFNSYVVPQVEIDNIGDSIVTTTLGLEAFDKYGNTVYKYFLPIQANDDGYVYERVEKSGQHSLMYTPTGQVYMTIHASEVKVDNTGNIINVSIPDGYIAYVKYKPAHMNQAVFSKITDEISISSDWQIKLTDYSCAHLEYRYIVHVFNPELTQINSTPIIKRLAIVQAEV